MIWRRTLKVLGWCALLLVAVGLAAPYFSVEQYALRLQTSLERSMGRKVELQGVRFSLFQGPGFKIRKVTIHEDPAIGMEPASSPHRGAPEARSSDANCAIRLS